MMLCHRVEYLLIELMMLGLTFSKFVVEISNLSKSYFKRPHFFSSQILYRALSDINFKIDKPITSFVGTSGSGKSTLGKILCGIESPTVGTIKLNTTERVTSSAYLHPHLYLDYNANLSPDELLRPFLVKKDSCPYICALDRILWCPAYIDTSISNLLETQRKSFEIYLKLAQVRVVSQTTTNSVCPLLILDEYLDKDLPSIKIKLLKLLRQLCEHPDINLKVIIITHSRSVMLQFSDYVLALNNGYIFSEGKPNSIVLPAQLSMIE